MTSYVKEIRRVEAQLKSGGVWTAKARVQPQQVAQVASGHDVAELALQLGRATDTGTILRAGDETQLPPGSEILLKFVDVGADTGDVLFWGYVAASTSVIDARGETVAFAALGLSLVLQEAFPVGAWTRTYSNFTGDDPNPTGRTLCRGLPPVFNPQGRGNASKIWFNRNDYDICPLFAPEDDVDLSYPWTYAWALLYCFEHAMEESPVGSPIRSIVFPDQAALEAITELTREVVDFRLEGRSWWENIVELLRQAGCRCHLDVSGDPDTLVATLRVWAAGSGATTTLKLQAVGSVLDPALSTLASCHWDRDGSGLVNAPVVLGGRKEIEGTFPLVPGWKTALLASPPEPGDEDYEAKFVRGGGQEFAYVDAGRLWVLNEAGQASGADYGSQALFDLTTALPSGVWSRRPRPFRPPISRHGPEVRVGEQPRAQITFDWSHDPPNWHELSDIGIEFLPEGAGLRITAADLDAIIIHHDESTSTYDTYWEQLTSEDAADIRVRVVACLLDDSRLLATPEVPAGCPVTRAIGAFFDRREKFVYRQRQETGDYASILTGDADEADDATALTAEGLRIQALTAPLTVRAGAQVTDVEGDYALGQRVTKIAGREISFKASGTMTPEVYPEIVAVTRHFGAVWSTELALEDGRAAALLPGGRRHHA